MEPHIAPPDIVHMHKHAGMSVFRPTNGEMLNYIGLY